MPTYESMELLGMQADRLRDLMGAMELPLDAASHLVMIRPVLFDVMEKLREVYIIETGDNPWL